MEMLSLLSIVASILLAGCTVKGADIEVEVEQGILLGQTVDFVENEYLNVSMKIDIFKGVPYAKPPVRFKAPEPPMSWEGVYDATEFSDWCSQLVEPGSDPFSQSEDCLYLNVFAPNGLSDKVPVMVFIHGGGFTVGSSMNYFYYGAPLVATGNVVVVNLNYRLGALGFLDTGNDASSGNFALLDQAEALKWIRQNIGAFGGDESKITIFGESAGAGSVDLHVVSKYSRDLFDQAIVQSGAATTAWAYREEFEAMKVDEAFRLGRAVGCDSTDTYELVDCLRLVDAQYLETTVIDNMIRMGPTVDGVFLDESPIRLSERGDFKSCPIVYGFNKDEGTIFLLNDLPNVYDSEDPPYVNKTLFDRSVTRSIFINNGVSHVIVEDAVKQQYVPWEYADDPNFDYFEAFNPIYGDEVFSCPAIERARAHVSSTSEPVYLYFMTVVPTVSIHGSYGNGPKWLGAAHGEELQFMFGYPFIPELDTIHGILTEPEKELSVKFMIYWTNFAKSGDPSRPDVSSAPGVGEWAWPIFTIPELQYKELSYEMNVGRGLKADECAFWNEFEPDLQSFAASMDQSEREWREEFSGWQDDLEKWRMSFADYQSNPDCEA